MYHPTDIGRAEWLQVLSRNTCSWVFTPANMQWQRRQMSLINTLIRHVIIPSLERERGESQECHSVELCPHRSMKAWRWGKEFPPQHCEFIFLRIILSFGDVPMLDNCEIVSSGSLGQAMALWIVVFLYRELRSLLSFIPEDADAEKGNKDPHESHTRWGSV